MPRHVLDVGNCDQDHQILTAYLQRRFDVVVSRAHDWDDVLKLVQQQRFDLVTVNRKLDADYSDGLEIIRRLKQDESLASIPVMLISNYPEHQQAATAAGAENGFGKLQYDLPATRDNLARFLESPA